MNIFIDEHNPYAVQTNNTVFHLHQAGFGISAWRSFAQVRISDK